MFFREKWELFVPYLTFFEIRYKKVAFCEAIAVECHSANGTLTALCGYYTAMRLQRVSM